MSDLAAFLAERLDEDEAAANAVYGFWRAHGDRAIADDSYAALLITDVDRATRSHILRHDPARVLREVEAKRAILKKHATCSCPEPLWLADVYSDHPDYDEAWKP